MAIRISRKIKFSLLIVAGLLISGLTYAYSKIFGDPAQPLPQNQFIVGESQKITLKPQKESPLLKEAQQKEIVAVAYSEDPTQGIREVIKRTGNLDFIQPGQKVLIKPNINSNDPAPGTTHPESLAEVIRLTKAKGAYVIVGDRSNPSYSTIPSMKTIGMYDTAIQAGADEIIGFEDEEWIRVSPEKAEHWPKGFRIPAKLQDIDHIISVPVLHTHVITSHSLAIKNLVGLIHPTDRYLFHASPNRDKMIAEIALAIKPSLTVIDGTKAFITKGPSHGTLAKPQVYLASTDVLTADVIGVQLLKKHGAQLKWDNPWDSTQISHFQTLNLSPYSKDQILTELTKI